MAIRLRRTAALPPLLVSLLVLPCFATAQARFDLPGPKLEIRVTRAGVTLPIASVPNLQPNDQIWLHPDLPASQSVHYLLIAAFLRGTTNPPPDSWFFRVETWQKRVREEGVIVTVPPEAQQAVLFLAPETGGDFTTLRSAVKGRPGIFVRASQDLNEAGFEQARIEKYLAEMKRLPAGDSAALADHSNLLARTLNLKPNPDCFKRPLDIQYACLTQTGTQTLLDDGHSQSIAAALSNGPSSDLINQASYTSLAGAGTYSAYVGAIVDLVRLTSGLHTAKYQYIPAIAFPGGSAGEPGQTDTLSGSQPGTQSGDGEALSLRLNTAPSFNNPKSVIVIGLPAVLPAILPPLRPVDPAHVSCLLNPSVVLPVDGAPLVFSTGFAHGLVLHLNQPAPATQKPAIAAASQNQAAPASGSGSAEIPLVPDAFLGGLVIARNPAGRKELPLSASTPAVPGPRPADATPPPSVTASAFPGQPITATIQGMWGFDRFTGPTIAVQVTPGGNWHIAPLSGHPSSADLIAGQPNHLQLMATGTACIQSVALEPTAAPVDWKLTAQPPSAPATASVPPSAPLTTPDVRPVELTLNLEHAATPGSIQLDIQQFGRSAPDHLGTRTFAEPARIAALQLHAGDTTLELTGTSLDQVKSLSIPSGKDDLAFTPAACPAPSSPAQTQAPSMTDVVCSPAPNGSIFSLPAGSRPPTLKPGEHLTAAVHLADGRILTVATTVLPPRPSVTLLSTHITRSPATSIQLPSPADLPLGAELTFFLKSATNFPRAEQVEIASLDASLHTTLSIAAGSLILQDAHTVLATFDPLKTFGPSTFGPFRLRAIAPDGTPGAWLPLATIVRLPVLTALHCPAAVSASCILAGSALYLIDSVSNTPDFTAPTAVPEGFIDSTLEVPHPLLSVPVAGPGAAPPPSLYIRLRDAPATTDEITIPIQTDSAPPGHSSQHPRPNTPVFGSR